MPGEHAKPSNSLLDALAPYSKSLAPLGAAIAGLLAACLPFTDGGAWWVVTTAEWSAFGAAIAAAGVAWLAPKNQPKKKAGAAGRRAVDRARQRGESALGLALTALVVVVIVVLLVRLL